ncbi:hypothetical protein ACF0H5_013063 [Mactra antiquata]
MNATVAKILVLASLFVMTFFFGVLPIILTKIFLKKSETGGHTSRYRHIMSFLSCYAAGVFLATGVLDLLPDSRVQLATTLNSMKVFTSFPVAEFVMMFGLFVILIIEQIVLTVKEKHMNENNEAKPLLPSTEEKRSYSHSITSQHSIAGISDEPIPSNTLATRTHRYGSYDDNDSDNTKPHHVDEHDILPGHEHSFLRSILLITALSLHSVFEGLAVGLQKTVADVFGIFAALVLHKSILSFSLSMNLIHSKLSHGAVIKSIIAFSLTSPIGIALGIGIMDLWDDSSSSLAQGILTGIACGTFLYVTFFEVLPAEFNSPDHRLINVLCLLLGFSTVTGVLFLNTDDAPTCYVVPP